MHGDATYSLDAVVMSALLYIVIALFVLARIPLEQLRQRITDTHHATPVHDARSLNVADWWLLPPASAVEASTMNAAEPDASPQRKLLLLRQLRVLGTASSGTNVAVALAKQCAEVDEWKKANLPAKLLCQPHDEHDELQHCWPSAADLAHGEWALGYICLGLRCGRARGGHPVKIERVGLAQTERMERETGSAGEERVSSRKVKSTPLLQISPFVHRALLLLCTTFGGSPLQLAQFYFAMIESMQQSLDAESLALGRMLGTYEIFDVRGMRLSQVSMVTMRFAKRMMIAFSKIYAETTVKVAIINLPWALRLPLAAVLEVLPARVRARVRILGEDFGSVLASEIDAEALRMLRAEAWELGRHRGRRDLAKARAWSGT